MLADTHVQWVPVAVARDVLNGTVIPATLPTGPIAVWRSASGQVNANGDRCPHRGMRLSHGFVRGEELSCIYHGWRFGQDGSCVHIPAHPNVVPPKSINCGPLPASEQDGVIWAAASAPDRAPPAFAGYDALRSLVFTCSANAVQAACDGIPVDGGLETQLNGRPAYLLLGAAEPGRLFVLALVVSDSGVADRLAASAALDALQRTAEAHDSQEVTG